MKREKKKLLEVKELSIYFKQKPGYLKAVDQVSFSIRQGETFGLIGESGSGKSTIGKSILRYYHLTKGEIFFDGIEIGKKKEKELLPFRKKMQSIFQDPYASLDPSQTVKKIVCEPMEIHYLYTKQEREQKAAKMMEMVGLSKKDLEKYPYEFSGGQRQRISIARALSIEPDFVLCDEPISALDVSLQSQIVTMLQEFQKKLGLTYLFISHQLQIVQQICNHIGVMYLGNLLEIAPSDALYHSPLHPYTKILICSVLSTNPKIKSLDNIQLDKGIYIREETGCKFYHRCPYAKEICKEKFPQLYEAEPNHFVACYLYQ